MADYSMLQAQAQPNGFLLAEDPWQGQGPRLASEKRKAAPIIRAPAFVDALSPGGVFYQGNPDRATQELQRLQQGEMKKVRQIETLMPGMGVRYWNNNPALKRLGSLAVRNENGVNVYSLNGQPIAYGTRGADNGYRISQEMPGQQTAGKAPRGQADQNRIERSGGQRPRETVLGVENVPGLSPDVHLEIRKGPSIGERIGSYIDAVEDVPRTLAQQFIGFPASKIGGAAAAVQAARDYPGQWLASKVSPSRVKPPENPLQTGQKAEKAIYDFIAQPERPRADLTDRYVKKVSEYPPLQLANSPFEWTRRVRNKFMEKGHPNLGYAAETAGDLGLMYLMGKGGEEAGLAERLAPEKSRPFGLSIRDAGEGEGKAPGVAKLPEGREAGVRSGAQVELDVLNGAPVLAEEMRRYPELLKKHEGAFVRTSKGSIDFGVLPKEVLPEGLPEGPIRLMRGSERFGEFHIETQRGALMRNEGFRYSRDFVEAAVKGATQVWEQPNGRLLLVKKNGKDYITVVELNKAPEGNFYSVHTAFATHDLKYAWRKSGGRKPVYEGAPLGSYGSEK